MTAIENGRTALRTCTLGQLSPERAGEAVTVVGWVHRRRDLGAIVFLDLRDRSGIVQISCGPDWTEAESLTQASDLGAEDVVRVHGTVRLRPPEARNDDMASGQIEVQALRLELLGEAAVPAIPVYRTPEEELPSEELRLQHRVLDLRRPELQQNLMLRHRLVLEARNYFHAHGFVEIETPMLTKRTPEGARDFLVPSRVHPGQFFALPQSPQIYKQILMVAGFDRYMQIARCFRDEDLRADRQPEFTQIDLEAAFIEPEDILVWIEGLMHRLATVAGQDAPLPFPRTTYRDVVERYGSDRPDLRCPIEIGDWSPVLQGRGLRIIDGAIDAGGRIRGLVVPEGAGISRKEIEALEGHAKKAGAPGLLWAKRTGEGLSGPLSKALGLEEADRIGLREGGLALAAAGADRITGPALDAVRVRAWEAAGGRLEGNAWLWVVDFPLFERGEDGTLAAGHHPFVMPHPEDMHLLDSDPAGARGLAYDLVYNGTEFGSGSLRIHRSALQRRIFHILGLEDGEIDEKFGFLLRALDAGAPPHGGIALGMDRIVQRFAGAASLRDVIAFPKTTAARALFESAPSPVRDEELAELHIRLRSPQGA
ncbi:MAG: aspartate--tRNA ligase [Gemmatimonadota bacterium]